MRCECRHSINSVDVRHPDISGSRERWLRRRVCGEQDVGILPAPAVHHSSRGHTNARDDDSNFNGPLEAADDDEGRQRRVAAQFPAQVLRER